MDPKSATYGSQDIDVAHYRNQFARSAALHDFGDTSDSDFDASETSVAATEEKINQLFWRNKFIQSLLADEDTESSDEETEISDDDSEEQPPKKKRTRTRSPWRDATKSRWWQFLQQIRKPDCTPYLQKRWLRRFRMPIDTFDSLVSLCEDKGWVAEVSGPDACGRPAKPFELKLMGALRFLGRGEVFDTIAECCDDMISEETFRVFTLWFCKKMWSIKDDYIRPPDPEKEEELEACMKPYADAGLPGCFGSVDGVAIAWSNAPAAVRQSMIGKVPYPHVGFNCVVNHARRFLSVSQVFAGGHNDLTKIHYDTFCQQVRKGMYKSIKVLLFTEDGTLIEHEDALYLICDGGYHKWKCMQPPTNFPKDTQEARYSAWVAKLRKDVECSFGILKKRFRCLKLPLFFKDIKDIEYVFVTCCILHNLLLDHRFRETGGWDGDERPAPVFRNPLTQRAMVATDATDYFALTTEFGDEGEDGDWREELSSYWEWRDRYVAHYNHELYHSRITWPGPVEGNSSMSTTLPE